jgi:hypothetical protein
MEYLEPVSVAATRLTANRLGKATAFTGCGLGGCGNRQDPARLDSTGSSELVTTDSETVTCS